jgi:ring-1,2-phenylacetyl-CoA epoxidase subunit PaaD
LVSELTHDLASQAAADVQGELDAIARRAHTLVADVPDPEIPVISIAELGILRSVQAVPHGKGHVIEVTITPTYSGCPAMDQIRDDILAELDAHEIPGRVRTQLAPAWTTDWMSDSAKAKLKAFGIAPPGAMSADSARTLALVRQPIATDSIATTPANTATSAVNAFKNSLNEPPQPVPCPRCDSIDTVQVSLFGSTACKSQLRCLHCKEPFDHFKPH